MAVVIIVIVELRHFLKTKMAAAATL